jgi:hypothetical protein
MSPDSQTGVALKSKLKSWFSNLYSDNVSADHIQWIRMKTRMYLQSLLSGNFIEPLFPWTIYWICYMEILHAIELSVKWYPVCFPLLSPPHAIVILYLYYVLTPLQPLYSQFWTNSVLVLSFEYLTDNSNRIEIQLAITSAGEQHLESRRWCCKILRCTTGVRRLPWNCVEVYVDFSLEEDCFFYMGDTANLFNHYCSQVSAWIST